MTEPSEIVRLLRLQAGQSWKPEATIYGKAADLIEALIAERDALKAGLASDKAIEAFLQSQCDAPGLHWTDGLSDGLRAIYRMKAEKGLAAVCALLSKEATQSEGEGR